MFALLLLGIWVEYEELYCYYGGPLTENAPPNGAVGVLVIILAMSAGLYLIRRTLRLTSPELVVIFAALLVAAPLMTQGMWHRFFGLLAAIPHNEDFKSYESLPPILWPHGPNMVDGNFTGKLGDFRVEGGPAAKILTWKTEEWRGKKWASPTLTNTNAAGSCALAIDLPKDTAHLVPGENILISALVKAQGFQAGSNYAMTLQADSSPPLNLVIGTADTAPSFALKQGFMRIGKCPVSIPRDLQDKLTLRLTLTGPGSLTVQDVQIFNSQAVEGLYTGRRLIHASNVNKLTDNDWDFTVVRPDNLFSPAGLNYLVHGFIPLKQWFMPALMWTLLIGALFAGFLGFNVIMRKQWTDNERFTFPMNLLPRHLLAEEADPQGRPYLAILRNKVMWLGFALAFILALLKGLHFYFPGVPVPTILLQGFNPSSLVTDPLLKVFFATSGSLTISLSLIAIVMLVETDILFSMWFAFLLFQLLPTFGKAFNWNHFSGYPWEFQQSIGSFIMYAVLAIIAARKHLAKVFRHIFGKARMDDSGEIFSYRTAAIMIVAALITLALWGFWTHMGWWVSVLFFGYMLVLGFTASKIRAEAGMPFAYWMPYFSIWFVSAIGGFATFGTTGMLVAVIASGFMCVSCFLFIAPVQVEMMELGRHFSVRPKDIGHGLTMGLVGGLFIGGFVVLCWAYGFGGDNLATGWPYSQNWYFSSYRQGEMGIDRALAANDLFNKATAPLSIENVDAKGIGIGVIVTGLLALLRSLFVWFPLHPLGYVLATTYFARGMWFTFLIAWAIRNIVLRIGGAHSIRKGLVPFCVGMFLACIASIMFFDILGIFLQAIGMTNIYCKMP